MYLPQCTGLIVRIFKDDANKNGGKWMVRLKKGIVSRCWENLVSVA